MSSSVIIILQRQAPDVSTKVCNPRSVIKANLTLFARNCTRRKINTYALLIRLVPWALLTTLVAELIKEHGDVNFDAFFRPDSASELASIVGTSKPA